jgi:glucose/arabinose dehydrogenase
MKKIFATMLILVAAVLAFLWYDFVGRRDRNVLEVTPASLREGNRTDIDIRILASGLEIPWSLDFLPDGRILVTERPGRVRIIDPQTGLLPEPALEVGDVNHRGEGGLLGLAVHPEFSNNRLVYLYYTYLQRQRPANKVVAYTFTGGGLSQPRIILSEIPGAGTHNGGRLKFGPDGLLYLTTGDAEAPEAAQDLESLAGKILRVREDGSTPDDNPFGNSPVYSYGHRNPQGLAWDAEGRLWATEHGPSGRDEINLIEPGKNYGWPVIQGEATAPAMFAPVLHSGGDTWAPSGAAVLDGFMYFAGLRGRALYRFNLDREQPLLQPNLRNRFGRLRDVVAGPDNLLYLITSNRDGRGIPTAEDDLALAVNPDFL